MHDALLVRVMHGVCHLFNQFRGKSRRLWFAVCKFGERSSFDQLERQIGMPVLLADVKDLNDARMLQTSDRLGLGAKTSEMVGRSVRACQDHLQSDQPFEP